jgi:hypothetical protein
MTTREKIERVLQGGAILKELENDIRRVPWQNLWYHKENHIKASESINYMERIRGWVRRRM